MPPQDQKKNIAKLKKTLAKAKAVQKKFASFGRDLQALRKESKKLAKKK